MNDVSNDITNKIQPTATRSLYAENLISTYTICRKTPQPSRDEQPKDETKHSDRESLVKIPTKRSFGFRFNMFQPAFLK